LNLKPKTGEDIERAKRENTQIELQFGFINLIKMEKFKQGTKYE